MTVSVALIGYGAIAAEVHRQVKDFPGIDVRQVLMRAQRCPGLQAELGSTVNVISSPDALASDTRIVLECAGHGAVSSYGEAVLRRGMTLGIVSVGALANAALHEKLERAAQSGGGRLVVLPGAIGGIDAIASAGPDNLTTVAYTGRKPPQAWVGSPAEEQFDLTSITAPTVLFSGTAREAAQQYPKNANVVATVALAGTGFDATRVSLIADPAATGNSHQITAQGPLLDLSYITAGAPLPSNPRTSALTAMSAVRLLRNLITKTVV